MKKLYRVLPILIAAASAFFLTGCKSELGQKMSNAALNTLMGMGVVFAVLILISFVISGFSLVNKLETRKKAAEAPAPVAPAEVLREEEEEETDDTELVAVIAAAIAAYEGKTPEGIRVRSIRRVGSARQWKRG